MRNPVGVPVVSCWAFSNKRSAAINPNIVTLGQEGSTIRDLDGITLPLSQKRTPARQTHEDDHVHISRVIVQ